MTTCAHTASFYFLVRAVVELDEQNFEHLTQAATGATSGDWLVLFCKESVPRCSKVAQNWQRVAVTLAVSASVQCCR